MFRFTFDMFHMLLYTSSVMSTSSIIKFRRRVKSISFLLEDLGSRITNKAPQKRYGDLGITRTLGVHVYLLYMCCILMVYFLCTCCICSVYLLYTFWVLFVYVSYMSTYFWYFRICLYLSCNFEHSHIIKKTKIFHTARYFCKFLNFSLVFTMFTGVICDSCFSILSMLSMFPYCFRFFALVVNICRYFQYFPLCFPILLQYNFQ